jgi:hypothetical protein
MLNKLGIEYLSVSDFLSFVQECFIQKTHCEKLVCISVIIGKQLLDC